MFPASEKVESMFWRIRRVDLVKKKQIYFNYYKKSLEIKRQKIFHK